MQLIRSLSATVLVPQPSDDPADPLNWSSWRKEAAFVTLCYATTLAGVIGPAVAPAFVALTSKLNQPLAKIAWINGKPDIHQEHGE